MNVVIEDDSKKNKKLKFIYICILLICIISIVIAVIILLQGKKHLSDDFAGGNGGDAAGIVVRTQLIDVAAHDVCLAAHQSDSFSQFLKAHTAWFRCSCTWKDAGVQDVQVERKVDRNSF